MFFLSHKPKQSGNMPRFSFATWFFFPRMLSLEVKTFFLRPCTDFPWPMWEKLSSGKVNFCSHFSVSKVSANLANYFVKTISVTNLYAETSVENSSLLGQHILTCRKLSRSQPPMAHHQYSHQHCSSKTDFLFLDIKTNIKYRFCLFVCFGQLFLVAISVFLNFTIIYKACKYHTMTFIGEIWWLINLNRESIVFPFIMQTSLSSSGMSSMCQLIKWLESVIFPISPPTSYPTVYSFWFYYHY